MKGAECSERNDQRAHLCRYIEMHIYVALAGREENPAACKYVESA
jgi:hypothetical protein